MNICVFGDSITWGAYDPINGGWVTLLKNYFEAKEEDISVYNLGIYGDTTTGLLKRIKIEAQSRNPDVIIFAIGINDAKGVNFTSDPQTRPFQFDHNLRLLLKIARQFTPTVCFIGPTLVDETRTSPNPWETGESYLNQNIKSHDGIIAKLCAKEKLVYISMQNIVDSSNLTDGLHPNTDGHRKIFEAVKPVVEKMLQSN